MFRAHCNGAIGRSPGLGMFHRYHHHATQHFLEMLPAPRSYHVAASDTYGKLNHAKSQIRVVKIEPGRWEDDISCRLKVISLSGFLRARYDTLSFTWGNSENRRTIRVNQQDIDVSANLFMALRALRCRFRTATVWADALCVNQKDDSEKSNQVAMMGEIGYHLVAQTRSGPTEVGHPHLTFKRRPACWNACFEAFGGFCGTTSLSVDRASRGLVSIIFLTPSESQGPPVANTILMLWVRVI